MQSDIIHVTSSGHGFSQALTQADKVAVYQELEHKQALHLRLFAEETMGMMRALTGEYSADFWIEAEHRKCILHLKAATRMDGKKRERLLSVSSDGKNAAATGFMGKIRDLFERALENLDENCPDAVFTHETCPGAFMAGANVVTPGVWSLNRYRDAVRETAVSRKDWDELERSVLSKLADEVKILIRSDLLEMIIEKQF